jgi:hypothetical protein
VLTVEDVGIGIPKVVWEVAALLDGEESDEVIVTKKTCYACTGGTCTFVLFLNAAGKGRCHVYG